MRRTQRSAEAATWQWLYNTGRWRKLRLLHLASEPLCRMCADEGRITAAQVVDHIKAHKGDEALFWDQGNWRSLCKSHHDSHAQSKDRTGKENPVIGLDGWPVERTTSNPVSHPEWFSPTVVPITIVCGPPASGKTTYVATNKGNGDLVIDLDAIALDRFGKPVALLPTDQRMRCIEARNQRLATLMQPEAIGSHGMAWLIVSEPSAAKRQWWQDKLQPASIVVLETPTPTCLARATADTQQQRPTDVRSRIEEWWRIYTPRQGETIIRPESVARSA